MAEVLNKNAGLKKYGLTVGLIVAIETESLLKRYKDIMVPVEVKGWEVWTFKKGDVTVYAINSRAGTIRAAAATQLLITKFDVDLIVNYGVAGAIRPEIAVVDTCVVEGVVHYEMDVTPDGMEPGEYFDYRMKVFKTDERFVKAAEDMGIRKVMLASGNRYVVDPDEKRKLAEDFDCDICEMEGAGIAITCFKNEVPCLMIKTISDSLEGGDAEYQEMEERAADVCLGYVDELIEKVAEVHAE